MQKFVHIVSGCKKENRSLQFICQKYNERKKIKCVPSTEPDLKKAVYDIWEHSNQTIRKSKTLCLRTKFTTFFFNHLTTKEMCCFCMLNFLVLRL